MTSEDREWEGFRLQDLGLRGRRRRLRLRKRKEKMEE
jgi:hypothetical protein